VSSGDRSVRVDAPLVRVVVYLHPAAVDQADELAGLRDRTRSQVLRDCVTWGLAREHAWRERNIAVARHREQLRADDAEALERTRLRHPERFDTS
jgi:hypothetical protein